MEQGRKEKDAKKNGQLKYEDGVRGGEGGVWPVGRRRKRTVEVREGGGEGDVEWEKEGMKGLD